MHCYRGIRVRRLRVRHNRHQSICDEEEAMADKKNDSSFTVTDRRLFTSDGELRSDVAEEVEMPKPGVASSSTEAPPKAPPATTDSTVTDREMPPPPSRAEQD